MRYLKEERKIIVFDVDNFNVVQTLNCGQIFRYVIDGEMAVVFSKDKKAILRTYNDRIEIATNDVEYFENFFDLKTDYSEIKKQLKCDKFLEQAVDFGSGIRILKNDVYEMIISFIISANNNIGRIKKSIEILCEKFGTNMGDYFAFPTLAQLKEAKVQDFKESGLGYRDEQMFHTVQHLEEKDIERLKNMELEEQIKFLLNLKGVGEKVANCILLFGLDRKDVFPVDTWINKVYNKLTGTQISDRKKITKELTARYGRLSGYAQQYFFYYFRENNIY